MSKLWAHLKNIGPWLLGLLGGFIVWLKFIHDPKVAAQARRKLKMKELDERRERLRDAGEDTFQSEARLNRKKRKLKEKLDEKVTNSDVDDAAERLSNRFGWGTGEGS